MFLTYTRDDINYAKNLIGDVKDFLEHRAFGDEAKMLSEALRVLEGQGGLF